jgi:hypothetical protein
MVHRNPVRNRQGEQLARAKNQDRNVEEGSARKGKGWAGAEWLSANGGSVEQQAGRAGKVGAEGVCMSCLEFREDFGARMTEAVAATAGDDSPFRCDVGEKLGARGRKTAMMTDFQYRAFEVGTGVGFSVTQSSRGKDGFLFGGLGVAG